MSGAAPSIVWFRRDLRVVDHEPLTRAAARGAVVCAYFVDASRWTPASARGRQLSTPRVGAHRTRFLLESLRALRERLRELGGDLVVRTGPPAAGLADLCRELGARAIYFHQDVGVEEADEERAVREAAAASAVEVHGSWDRTLLAPADLPFAVSETPESFSAFRKKVERSAAYAAPLAAPAGISRAPGVSAGAIPDVAALAGVEAHDDVRAPERSRGGEREAWQRLDRWVWDEDRLRRYKQTRNGMLGADYSSRLSPYLAHGCISPRSIQAEVARYERERVANESTYWMTFELLWRDYFQWITQKHGAALFRPSGLQGVPVPWRRDEAAFARWRDGQTGFPMIDGCMRELAATGHLSNRGRQVVTSFLTKNLGVDWRWGAEWFEATLVDYDVGSNYGNWNYGAGVGNDSRGFRYFNLRTQAEKYDRDGRHARRWCPELAGLPPERVHAPWQATDAERAAAGLVIGQSYPARMVDLDRSADENRSRWERAVTA